MGFQFVKCKCGRLVTINNGKMQMHKYTDLNGKRTICQQSMQPADPDIIDKSMIDLIDGKGKIYE